MSAILSEEIAGFAASALGEGADGELLEKLCAAAASELEEKLAEGVKIEDIKERFVTAAGILALSMYSALGGRARPKGFRAGQLSVDFGDKPDADKLRKTAESLLAGYLRDRGFAFLGVGS